MAGNHFLYHAASTCIFRTTEKESEIDDNQLIDALGSALQISEPATGESTDMQDPAKATLVLTHRCMLRCKYCVYSDDRYGNHRTHGTARLNPLQAMAFIEDCSLRWLDRKLFVDFFGGEPLMELKTLKQIVQSAERISRPFPIEFGITTNGILLTSEACNFLSDHNIFCCISLDGPREIHDRNRVFLSGLPTYDKIWDNIATLKERHPEYFRSKVQFMATLEQRQDVIPTIVAFDQHKFYNSQYRSIKLDYSKGEMRVPIFRGINRQLLGKMLKACQQNNFERTVLYGSDFLRFCLDFDRRTIVWGSSEPSGAFCIPYSTAAVLQIDGTVSFCNFAETHRFAEMKSGKLYVDEDKLQELEKARSKFAAENCRNCWASRLCKLCWVHFLDVSHKSNSNKLSLHCVEERKRVHSYVRGYLRLKLMDNKMFHKIEQAIPVANGL
ncbi:MAG: hypothetical protein NT025_09770 [bacterium]|nr:hypothetical protein [bacterium]